MKIRVYDLIVPKNKGMLLGFSLWGWITILTVVVVSWIDVVRGTADFLDWILVILTGLLVLTYLLEGLILLVCFLWYLKVRVKD